MQACAAVEHVIKDRLSHRQCAIQHYKVIRASKTNEVTWESVGPLGSVLHFFGAYCPRQVYETITVSGKETKRISLETLQFTSVEFRTVQFSSIKRFHLLGSSKMPDSTPGSTLSLETYSTVQSRSFVRYENCVNRLRAARIQLQGAPRCQRTLLRAGSQLEPYSSDQFRSVVRSYNWVKR